MQTGIKFPDHIGISEVTTRSFEHMRVESYFEGQPRKPLLQRIDYTGRLIIKP